jgi:uncharacterized metal-binding protein
MNIAIVPCSGIGKTYGSVTREAAYIVVEELRPGSTGIVSLSRLVLGEEEARSVVRAMPVITLDGCKLACASVNVQQAGGTVARDFTVLDCYRRHRACKPKGIAQLNEGGMALADALAREVSEAVDTLQRTPNLPDLNLDPATQEASEELAGVRQMGGLDHA